MLQKDGFFRKRDDGLFNKSSSTLPAPAANAAPLPTDAARAEVRADERKEAKLVVGPEIKIKGVEISDCDTLVVEGRIEATLDSRVLEITSHGVWVNGARLADGKLPGKLLRSGDRKVR